jgi:hypothetical protein
MASKALVIAHDNDFNKGILRGQCVLFFQCRSSHEHLENHQKNDNLPMVESNYEAIINEYNWKKLMANTTII